MSYRLFTKGLLPIAGLVLSQSANAQIVIGPAIQEVPIFGAPLLITLGGFLAFIAYKFGLLKNATNLAIIIGLAGAASIGGGIKIISDAEAGTSPVISVSGTSDTPYTITPGDVNTYNNTSGIDLKIKSISLGSCSRIASPNDCTVGNTLTASGPGSSCFIDCRNP